MANVCEINQFPNNNNCRICLEEENSESENNVNLIKDKVFTCDPEGIYCHDFSSYKESALHCFHGKCIGPWLKNHKICPTCRQPMQKAETVYTKMMRVGSNSIQAVKERASRLHCNQWISIGGVVISLIIGLYMGPSDQNHVLTNG